MAEGSTGCPPPGIVFIRASSVKKSALVPSSPVARRCSLLSTRFVSAIDAVERVQHAEHAARVAALVAVEPGVDLDEIVLVVGVEGERVLVLDVGYVGVRDDDVVDVTLVARARARPSSR